MKKWARKRLLDPSVYANPPFSGTKREEVIAESGSKFAFDNVVEQTLLCGRIHLLQR